ncbi:MAG: TetR/AcrR family transcriptional regulator [Candidatus Izemoplasmataceae bacterium]
MPKAFSETEKIIIKKEMITVTKDLLNTHGAKKVTVDDIVHAIGIAKGSFYLFYDSKEHLFYEVFRIYHDQIQDDFIASLKAHAHVLDKDSLLNAIMTLIRSLDDTFMYHFIADKALDKIMRKLPIELVEDHQKRDELVFYELTSLFPNQPVEKILLFGSSLRLLMTSLLHKRDIGEVIYYDTLAFSIKAIINQLLTEEDHD